MTSPLDSIGSPRRLFSSLETNEVTRGQIWQIWRMRAEVCSPFDQWSWGDGEGVIPCIVLVEEHFFFPRFLRHSASRCPPVPMNQHSAVQWLCCYSPGRWCKSHLVISRKWCPSAFQPIKQSPIASGQFRRMKSTVRSFGSCVYQRIHVSIVVTKQSRTTFKLLSISFKHCLEMVSWLPLLSGVMKRSANHADSFPMPKMSCGIWPRQSFEMHAFSAISITWSQWSGVTWSWTFVTTSSVLAVSWAPDGGSRVTDVRPRWNSLNYFLTFFIKGERSLYTALKRSSVLHSDFTSKNRNRIANQ